MKKTAHKKQKSAEESKSCEENIIEKFADRAFETAWYYGFAPAPAPQISKDDLHRAKIVLDGESRRQKDSAKLCVEEKIAILRNCADGKWRNFVQPAMVAFERPQKNSKEKEMCLEIIGTNKSLAEAVLMETAKEILLEEGYENISVNVNSIGDRESAGRFARDLGIHYRKNIDELCANCRDALRRDVYETLLCDKEICAEVRETAPKSIACLTELSREHFKEVLEYLETLDIPYSIKEDLVGNRAVSSNTIFEICGNEKGKEAEVLAIGSRYNNLAKKLNVKKDIPAIGVCIRLKRNLLKKASSVKIRKAKIYFIHLGFEAKLKSLRIIEILRQAKIPICQSISKDKMVAQIASAENMKVPYAIIMGQKEAIDGTVIVRNMTTRSQDTIKVEKLAEYLKKIK